ncbi:hypothetical protein [Aequorivita echinoideorum]|uniref:LPXTG-motif cell wall anchor domain-containing protein n=1 Tax=Aequorivita echinoideorum TaxID=1549647 RepID=A0ABS5S2I8_9FLAO|nr:hypothetical protein [Aequorivita echinoideorum]MBT0607427.1 hypothetical protein [Aequorivita echinoideorum]
MANKLYRLFEYAYIIIAIFFAYQAVVNWTTEPNRAYLFLFFVIVAIFMFFFKRNFRKKMEERNKK